MKVKAPSEWDLNIWREARETGLDVTLTHEKPDFELVIRLDTLDKGVRSSGPEKDMLKIMHHACIKGLTEPNPLWRGEWCERPMHTKPKDMGYEVLPGPFTVTINIGTRLETERLARCRAALVRSIVHAFVSWQLLKA